ncbi:MAG: hypothetical protein FWG94_02020 [Oscillospiraceae bacterium]|nr:hypothetical protein [Oscillospiraceae bacterium]
MKNTNASPIIFGWDFQINAAIILFLENIKEVKSIRVEGMTEDIEITLNNGRSIYSQSKAVERENDYTNVLKKLKEAIITLDAACKQVNCEKII